eukprot:COSAG02_NODE_8347_length_2603_cov_1.735224_4_plen_69_part_00
MDIDPVANPAQGAHVGPGGARMTVAAVAGLACREQEAMEQSYDRHRQQRSYRSVEWALRELCGLQTFL